MALLHALSADTSVRPGAEAFTANSHASDVYVCPGDKLLTTTGSLIYGATLRYRASKHEFRLRLNASRVFILSGN